ARPPRRPAPPRRGGRGRGAHRGAGAPAPVGRARGRIAAQRPPPRGDAGGFGRTATALAAPRPAHHRRTAGARVSGLYERIGDGPAAGDTEPALPPPEGGRAKLGTEPTFANEANDIRFVHGGYDTPGPAATWLRLTVPVVAGEPTSPAQRALAAADFGNGVSAALDWDAWSFINPDLTVYLERDPEGEWIALDAVTRLEPDGTGTAESVLHDERGRFGRAVQALLVQARR